MNNSVMPYDPSEKPSEPLNISGDIDYARSNIIDLIEIGKASIEDLAGIASQSQHPNSYNALSTMISTLVAANKEIIATEFKRKSLEVSKESAKTPVINNNLVISSEDLLKMIKEKKHEKI